MSNKIASVIVPVVFAALFFLAFELDIFNPFESIPSSLVFNFVGIVCVGIIASIIGIVLRMGEYIVDELCW